MARLPESCAPGDGDVRHETRRVDQPRAPQRASEASEAIEPSRACAWAAPETQKTRRPRARSACLRILRIRRFGRRGRAHPAAGPTRVRRNRCGRRGSGRQRLGSPMSRRMHCWPLTTGLSQRWQGPSVRAVLPGCGCVLRGCCRRVWRRLALAVTVTGAGRSMGFPDVDRAQGRGSVRRSVRTSLASCLSQRTPPCHEQAPGRPPDWLHDPSAHCTG
jgi:hypothetical protein